MNPYAQFLGLLPKNVKTVGKVLVVETDGSVTLEMAGSNTQILVRGTGGDTYSVGDHVFVQDGAIVGKTPPLQVIVNIEVM